MKKLLMSAMSVVMMSGMVSTAMAQEGLSLSIKATPGFSFLQNSDDNDNSAYEKEATFKSNFGIGATYHFTSDLGVGLDVLYGMQGQKYKVANVEFNQRLDYLKIPLYFTFNTDPAKSVGFYGKVGPQLNLLTNAEIATNGSDNFVENKDHFESATFGAMVNLGAQFKLANNLSLQAGVYFDYDFTNAENKDFSRFPTGRANTNNMNTGIQVGLNYHF